jgi:hypothetical protein
VPVKEYLTPKQALILAKKGADPKELKKLADYLNRPRSTRFSQKKPPVRQEATIKKGWSRGHSKEAGEWVDNTLGMITGIDVQGIKKATTPKQAMTAIAKSAFPFMLGGKIPPNVSKKLGGWIKQLVDNLQQLRTTPAGDSLAPKIKNRITRLQKRIDRLANETAKTSKDKKLLDDAMRKMHRDAEQQATAYAARVAAAETKRKKLDINTRALATLPPRPKPKSNLPAIITPEGKRKMFKVVEDLPDSGLISDFLKDTNFSQRDMDFVGLVEAGKRSMAETTLGKIKITPEMKKMYRKVQKLIDEGKLK